MQQENTIKIQCSNCHQQLRIPCDRGNLKIKCPTCEASGIWRKDNQSNNDLNWLLNASSEEINRGSISLMDTSMASGNFTSGFVNPNKYKYLKLFPNVGMRLLFSYCFHARCECSPISISI